MRRRAGRWPFTLGSPAHPAVLSPRPYPGHCGGRRKTGCAGWGPAAPACPRPRRHPGVGSEGWGLCPQSGSPLKGPGPHLDPGHHRWRSLPVRPGPSRFLDVYWDLVQVFQEGCPSHSGGLGDVKTTCSAEHRGGRMEGGSAFRPKTLLLHSGPPHHGKAVWEPVGDTHVITVPCRATL